MPAGTMPRSNNRHVSASTRFLPGAGARAPAKIGIRNPACPTKGGAGAANEPENAGGTLVVLRRDSGERDACSVLFEGLFNAEDFSV